MYNSGGAIESLIYQRGEGGKVAMEAKGCGLFGAYSSSRPTEYTVASAFIVYEFDSSKGLLILNLDKKPEEGQYHYVEIKFYNKSTWTHKSRLIRKFLKYSSIF
ncbi:hypothetical protein Syun_025710 [Stephania yunnanensis]|uniref:Uncharacterized protein n=1 Tax=Stephania yunnanensis TaxID=152371 RepID=A0AAP0ES62_9MAGN